MNNYQPSIDRMNAQAAEIDAAIAAGTVADHPQFRNVHPDSLIHCARAQAAAFRESARRLANS